MRVFLFYLIYNIFLVIVFPIVFLIYFFHTIFVTKIPMKTVMQRFGFFLPISAKDDKVIWLHGVSSGEISACMKLVNLLIKNNNYKIFLSTATPSGYDTLAKINNDNIVPFYNPIDYPFLIRRLISRIKPIALILSEVELWPNMLRIAKANDLFVFMVNGRVENNSYPIYCRFKTVSKYMLDKFNKILIQSEIEYKKYMKLNANKDKALITGNLKFDYNPPKKELENSKDLKNSLQLISNDMVIIFASTHHKEYDLLLNIYPKIKSNYPKLKLIIAPRHPEKKKSIESSINKLGLGYSLRSKYEPFNQQIYILDTIGELFNFFSISDIVIMGGSFSPDIGGHNILEPAYFSKPIIVGEYNYSLQEIFNEFMKNNAIIQTNKDRLEKDLLTLIESDGLRKNLGEKANRILLKGMGASKLTYDHITDVLVEG